MATRCRLCPWGKYQPFKKSIVCDACPHGQGTSPDGSSCSAACGPGRYRSKGHTLVGGFTETNQHGKCVDCGPGRYAEGTDKASCAVCVCPYGKYQRTKRGCACADCTAGRFQTTQYDLALADKKAAAAAGARGGSKSDGPPQGAADSAADGNTGAEGVGGRRLFGTTSGGAASSATATPAAGTRHVHHHVAVAKLPLWDHLCARCPAGKYQPTAGRNRCRACAEGRAQPGSGSTACARCASGRFQPQAGGASCKQCTGGTHLTRGRCVKSCPKVRSARRGTARFARSCRHVLSAAEEHSFEFSRLPHCCHLHANA
jgi:hypothetical protein